MATSRKVVRPKRLVLASLVAFLAILLYATTACALGPTSASDPAPPIPYGPHIEPIFVGYTPPITAEVGLDVTTSYPRRYFDEAKVLVANWVDDVVMPNSGGMVVYVTYINSHSFDPASTAMVLTVPPLPADPPPPHLQPTPRPTGNPYVDVQKRAQVQASNAALMRRYEQTLIGLHAHLEHVREQVHQETNALRALNPAADASGTSVCGAIQTAADRFQGVSGDKHLILASDLDENRWADCAPPFSLRGVTVTTICYVCRMAQSCHVKTSSWRQRFLTAGAASVQFVDPAASLIMPTPFGITKGAAS